MPALPIDHSATTDAADGARLPPVLMRWLPTTFQRAQRYAVQRTAIPDGYRATRCPLAPALQARAARRGETPAPAWLHHQPRDNPPLGAPRSRRSSPISLAACGGIGAAPAARHDGSPRVVSQSHPLARWSNGDPSSRSISEQPNRTITSAVETAVLPDAVVRELRFGIALLYSAR